MPIIRELGPTVAPVGPVRGPQVSGGDLLPGQGALQGAGSSAIGATRRAIGAEQAASRAEARVGEAEAAAATAWGRTGTALEQMGAVLGEIDAQATKAARAAKLAGVKARYGQRIQEVAFGLQNGDGTNPAPPAEQHLVLFDKAREQLVKEAQKELGDDAASFAAFQNEFGQQALSQRLDVLKHKIERTNSEAVTNVKNGLRTHAFSAAGANPRARQPILASAEQSVFDLEQNGLINAEQRQTMLNGFYGDIANADVMRMLRGADGKATAKDADRTAAFLRENPMAGWDVDTQQKWIEKSEQLGDARRAKARAEAEHAITIDDKNRRKAAEAAEKELIDARRKGDPNLIALVESKKATLTADQYRFHLDAARRPLDVVRNNTVYMDLSERADRAKTQAEKDQVLRDARTAASGATPSISVEDYDRVRKELSLEKRPAWYTRGKEFISINITGDLSKDQKRREKRDPTMDAKLANALDDWERWEADHREAGDDEADRAYRRITETAKAMARPVNVPLQLAKLDPKGEVDFQGTGVQIQKALQGGHISRWEYYRQMGRLGEAMKQAGVLRGGR